MRRVILMFTFLAVVGSACSGGSGHASPTTPAPPGPNPDVIPQVITVDYVNAVFKVLNHLDGDVTRSLVADKTITPHDYAILRAVYNDPLYNEEVNIAHETLQGDMSLFRNPPGDIVTTVRKMVDASPTCIFVETTSRFDQVVVHPTQSAGSEFWKLSMKRSADDPEGLNPTPWSLTFNANFNTPTTIPDQCSVGS